MVLFNKKLSLILAECLLPIVFMEIVFRDFTVMLLSWEIMFFSEKAFLLWSVSTAFPKVFQTTTGFVSSPKFTPTKQESTGGAAHKKDVTKSQKWVSGVVPIPPAANLR